MGGGGNSCRADAAARGAHASDGTVQLFEAGEVINVATMGDFGRRFVPGTRMPSAGVRAGRPAEARQPLLEQRTRYRPDDVTLLVRRVQA